MRIERPSTRRLAFPAVMLAALSTLGHEAQAAGIVKGPSMRLSGTHTFTFTPSVAGGTVTWTLDRETISDAGIHTRTNGIATKVGTTASFSLTAVSGSETIYSIHAADAGAQDSQAVQVFPADTKSWFTYHSAGNPDVRVYITVPSALNAATTRVLLAMHGNTRTASSYADTWRPWAVQQNSIVLCPYYDLVNWPTSDMYQMGNVFSGADCDGVKNPPEKWTFTIDVGIHQQVRDGFGIIDPLFDMWGFSGGGQHVHRFMLFMPNAPVRLAIAAGSGWYTVPDPAIDCPYGPDDPLDFTSQQILNWTNRNMVIMVGTCDTLRDDELRTTARSDAQGLNRYERAGYMMNKARAFNPSTRWRRIDVIGAAHESKPMAAGAQGVMLQSVTHVRKTPPVETARMSFRIGPNPLARNSFLWGEGWRDEEVEIDVYDLLGRRVAAGTAPVVNGSWRIAWSKLRDGGGVSSGIYLVRAHDREQRSEKKVVVTE